MYVTGCLNSRVYQLCDVPIALRSARTNLFESHMSSFHLVAMHSATRFYAREIHVQPSPQACGQAQGRNLYLYVFSRDAVPFVCCALKYRASWTHFARRRRLTRSRACTASAVAKCVLCDFCVRALAVGGTALACAIPFGTVYYQQKKAGIW